MKNTVLEGLAVILVLGLASCEKKTDGKKPSVSSERLPDQAAVQRQQEPGAEAAATQPSLSDVKPGVYGGSAPGVEAFSVALVSVENALRISEVGYKFAGSLEVEHAFLKTGKPFGTVVKDKVRFQFPVFVRFSPSTSLTSESGGNTSMANYSAELVGTGTPDELQCKLVQIDKMDKEYEGFTFRDIGLRTPDSTMQKGYAITLKRVAK